MSAVAVELYYDDWSEERRNPDVPDIDFATAPGRGVSALDDFDSDTVLEPMDFSEAGGRESLAARRQRAEFAKLELETRLFELDVRDARRALGEREERTWWEFLFG